MCRLTLHGGSCWRCWFIKENLSQGRPGQLGRKRLAAYLASAKCASELRRGRVPLLCVTLVPNELRNPLLLRDPKRAALGNGPIIDRDEIPQPVDAILSDYKRLSTLIFILSINSWPWRRPNHCKVEEAAVEISPGGTCYLSTTKEKPRHSVQY
jgi:hypothetical protein